MIRQERIAAEARVEAPPSEKQKTQSALIAGGEGGSEGGEG